jgi:hypothetical protein
MNKTAKKVETTGRPVTLAVAGTVRDGGMHLRTVHASGKVEHDGVTWKVEYAVTMGGTPLVTLSREGVEGWTTYSLGIDGILRAACNVHFERTDSPRPSPDPTA